MPSVQTPSKRIPIHVPQSLPHSIPLYRRRSTGQRQADPQAVQEQQTERSGHTDTFVHPPFLKQQPQAMAEKSSASTSSSASSSQAAAQASIPSHFHPDHRLALGSKKLAEKIFACHADVVNKVEQDLQSRLGWNTSPSQVQISTVTRSELRERLAADWGVGRSGLFAKIGAFFVSFFVSTYYSPSLDSNDLNSGQKAMGRIFVVGRNARSHDTRRLRNQLAQALTLAAIHQHTASANPPYSDVYSTLVDYLRNPHRHRAELHGLSAAMYALAQNVAQRQAPIKHATSRWQRVGQWLLRPWLGDYLKPMAIGQKLQDTMGQAVKEDPKRIHRAFVSGEVWAAICCKPGILELVYNADRHPGLTHVEQVRRDAVYFAKLFNPKAHAVSFSVTSLTPEPQM